MTSNTEPRRTALPRRRARGFTLVELMVSMAAGLLIAAAAFLLARNATTFFQAEANITSAQFSTMVGLTRLQADLRRAGFLSTPNIVNDPKRCGGPAGYPNGLVDMGALHIVEGGSAAAHGSDLDLITVTNSPLDPDSIDIAGQLTGTEQYTIQAMETDGSGGWNVLIARDGALIRAETSAYGADATLANVFKVGSFIRLVDKEGRQAFGLVAGFTPATSPNYPQVHVDPLPVLPVRETQVTCGCELPCNGSVINAIHLVRWDIRQVDPATYTKYAGLFQGGSHGQSTKHVGPTAVARTELVRVELDSAGAEVDDTLEVIAEYAVDLKFGITVATPAVPLPTMTRYPIGNASVYTVADLPSNGGTPEHIRAVQVRVSTRSSRRDRDVALSPTGPAGGGLYRFNLGTNQGFARMRTLVSDVRLPNLANVPW